MTTPTKHKGRFQPGVSGNAKGRPRGVGEVSKIRAAISSHVPKIIKALVARALDGDPQAAKLLLERAVPALKPTDLDAAVSVSGDTLTEKGAAIFDAVATGKLSHDQGRSMLAGLEVLSQLRAGDEFEKRLQALEAAQDGSA